MNAIHEKSHPQGLVLITGCMFAGKTTALIARLTEAAARGDCVVSLKHAVDTRYDIDALATHDRQRFPARPIGTTRELAEQARGAEVVGVDEIHFFDDDLLIAVADLLEAGVNVILAGLDYDVWGIEFPVVAALKTMASEVLVVTAPCTVCGAGARHSQRMIPLEKGRWVGGPEAYEARCEAHFEPFWQSRAEFGGR